MLPNSSCRGIPRASLLVLALVAAAVSGCGRDERMVAAVRTEIRSDLKRRDLPADAAWRDRR
ncbi:MAG: hypothetical protein ABIP29_06040, partial [Candidatus Eisenbacteria bacterium]